jgi:hypothetical protein
MTFISEFDQVLAAFVQQPAVRRMGDGFGHHSGIDNNFVQTAFLDQARCAGCLDGDGEQELDTFFANAFPPARQTEGVNGSSVCR